jgi:type I restriction-modification system DNA methylase subunit
VITANVLKPDGSVLERVYETLGYNQGILLEAVKYPKSSASKEAEAWVDKGDWLSLAVEVGVKKVFFVRDEPTLVFYEFPDTPSPADELNVFRRVWCMARPQCLFMAMPDKLKVYSLNQTPVEKEEDWPTVKTLKNLDIALDSINETLKDYTREQIESGNLFASAEWDGIENRADNRLINDLKKVRQLLLKEPALNGRSFNPSYAHALIGRSIFIRYLEDRGVLDYEYFRKIADTNPTWREALLEQPKELDLTPGQESRFYDRVLNNKNFTYALFKQLTNDFNGDIFPEDAQEKEAVSERHLKLLQSFLRGDTDPSQGKMFFWAYDFKVIPLELISNIYEEFYHTDNNADDKGTHYTPGNLVEYALSEILKPKILEKKPRILDPACGSGIFLVEAFRRVVRYNVQQNKGNPLKPEHLRQILGEQIAGIEINAEAARVAAFSLYLALLNYLDPPTIWANLPLPKLIYVEGHVPEYSYHSLFTGNTFSLMDEERETISKALNNPKFKGRVEYEKLLDYTEKLPFSPNSFDVIVGNPPWGFKRGATTEIQEAQEQASKWCKVNNWSIGDRELSQAFIARTLSLMKPNGHCGFLVSSGIFFKQHENSQNFRRRWLKEATIQTVINFVHVRHTFFSATAPFVFVHYINKHPDPNHYVRYWSARKTETIENIKTVILNYNDFRQVLQQELRNNDYLWRVYWWGSHRDAALISRLKLNPTLEQLAYEREWPIGRGYEGDFPTGEHHDSDWLRNYKQFPIDLFKRYGPIYPHQLTPVPDLVYRFGNQDIYDGWRLLVKHGISQANGANGRIEARLDNLSYCFTNSINGINLDKAEEWERKILIGIMWSSLARYFYFMTISSWGTWHNQMYVREFTSLPICFPSDITLRKKIIRVVDRLQNWHPSERNVLNPEGQSQEDIDNELKLLEHELDEAIFEVYKLLEAERDLIRDMCNFGIEFFYRHSKSNAAQTLKQSRISQGSIYDISSTLEEQQGLEPYLYTFLNIWNRELAPESEFRWKVIRPANLPMMAVVFINYALNSGQQNGFNTDTAQWEEILHKCEEVLRYPVAQQIYIDGMLRVVTNKEVIIIKRKEQMLWTRSLAREDAEATLVQLMNSQTA